MLNVILEVANVVVPVLLCVSCGFALAKLNVPFDHKVINGLVTNVGYPTLILSHLSAGHVNAGQFFHMMGAALAVLGAFTAIGFLFLRLMGLPTCAFLSPIMHNNAGNMGLPITLLAFGNVGMAYGMAFVVVTTVSIFTIGVWITAGKASFGDLLRNPIVYAVVLALILLGTGTHLPKPVGSALDILGGLSIPLMLLTLGHTLATLQVRSLWRGIYLSLFHIAMAIAVVLCLLQVFDFDATQRGVFILSCLMPVAVGTYLFVERYTPDYASDVAGFILVSTILSIFTISLALAFWV